MHRVGLPLVLVLAVTAGCAPPPSQTSTQEAGRACFWASQVSGFSDAGADRALVRIGMRETWELTLSPGCPDVDWATRIGIRSRGSERICSGTHAELLVPTAAGDRLQRCLVRSVRRLSSEEAAATRRNISVP